MPEFNRAIFFSPGDLRQNKESPYRYKYREFKKERDFWQPVQATAVKDVYTKDMAIALARYKDTKDSPETLSLPPILVCTDDQAKPFTAANLGHFTAYRASVEKDLSSKIVLPEMLNLILVRNDRQAVQKVLNADDKQFKWLDVNDVYPDREKLDAENYTIAAHDSSKPARQLFNPITSIEKSEHQTSSQSLLNRFDEMFRVKEAAFA